MSAVKDFEQAGYWIKRHEDLKGDPRSVGNLGASLQQNEVGERALVDTIDAVAAVVKSDLSSVLDLGCGYGRVTGAFLGHGMAYKGFDVSPVAVAEARQSWPQAEFREADLLKWEPAETYDLVCILYVLVHFVQDTDWERFFRSAAHSVAPGGYLVIADSFPAEERQSAAHYVARPFSDYAPLMQDCGLTVDDTKWAEVFSDRPADPHGAHFRFLKKSSS